MLKYAYSITCENIASISMPMYMVFCDFLWVLERKDGGIEKNGETSTQIKPRETGREHDAIKQQGEPIQYKSCNFGFSWPKMGGEWVLNKQTKKHFKH